jgi:hypothetical protein
MRILRKVLPGVLILALLYGLLLLVERLTTQELTRATEPQTQESICLIWKPRFLRGDGVCSLDLLDARGKAVDTVGLGTLDTAFNALQQYGQLVFQGQEVTVSQLRTGELVRRFVVQDGRLRAAN